MRVKNPAGPPFMHVGFLKHPVTTASITYTDRCIRVGMFSKRKRVRGGMFHQGNNLVVRSPQGVERLPWNFYASVFLVDPWGRWPTAVRRERGLCSSKPRTLSTRGHRGILTDVFATPSLLGQYGVVCCSVRVAVKTRVILPPRRGLELSWGVRWLNLAST